MIPKLAKGAMGMFAKANQAQKPNEPRDVVNSISNKSTVEVSQFDKAQSLLDQFAEEDGNKTNTGF